MIGPLRLDRMRKHVRRAQPIDPTSVLWIEPERSPWWDMWHPSTGAGKNAYFDEILRSHNAAFTRADLKPGEFIYITKDKKIHRSSE